MLKCQHSVGILMFIIKINKFLLIFDFTTFISIFFSENYYSYFVLQYQIHINWFQENIRSGKFGAFTLQLLGASVAPAATRPQPYKVGDTL